MLTLEEIGLHLESIVLEEWLYENLDLLADETIEINLNDFERNNVLEVYIVTEFEDGGETHRFMDFLFNYDFNNNTGVHRGLLPYMSLRAIGDLERQLINIGRRF